MRMTMRLTYELRSHDGMLRKIVMNLFVSWSIDGSG